MKNNIISAIRLTLVCLVLLSGVYTLIVIGIAKLVPNNGKGETVTYNGKTYYSNIGQSFTEDKYFNSRPSAVGYNAAGSGASNKGPSNPDYLAQVQARIDTILTHNPGINRSAIPIDLVTASGSGLDPHISVNAAMMQVKRISKIRQLKESTLLELVNKCIEQPVLGMFGPKKINVLKLNIELENLK